MEKFIPGTTGSRQTRLRANVFEAKPVSGFPTHRWMKMPRTRVLLIRPDKLLWLPIVGMIGYALLQHGTPHILFQYEYAVSGSHLSCTYLGRSIRRTAPFGEQCPFVRFLKSGSEARQ